MRSRLMVGLVTAALVAVPLACGDDDDDGGLGGASEVTESGDSDTTAGSSDDTAADDTASDETAGEEPTGGDLVRWCEITADLDDNPLEGLADDAPPDEVEAAFADLGEQLDEYVDTAPDQIRDDVETLTNAIEQLADILASHDYDIATAATDPELGELVNASEFEEAGNRVDEFEDANCS